MDFNPNYSKLESEVNDETATSHETSLKTPNTVSIPSKSALSRQKQIECESTRPNYVMGDLLDILSPQIFSQVDPFRYIVDITLKISNSNISEVRLLQSYLLQTEQLPVCYIPYAKTLFSLLRCWPEVDAVKQIIRRIQTLLPPNDDVFSFLPSDISLSPQLLQLFSAEIFADPSPPLRIFYKLLNMSKNDILNLKAKLQTFIERSTKLQNIPFRKRYYIWYAKAVWKLIENEIALDDLKRDMAVIQRMAISRQRFLPSR